MPIDLPGGVLPHHDGANAVTVHSKEFCPDAEGCRQHRTVMGNLNRRKLKPCAKCGATRFRNVRGFLRGKPAPLCGTCKASSFPGKPPQFLRGAAA